MLGSAILVPSSAISLSGCAKLVVAICALSVCLLPTDETRPGAPREFTTWSLDLAYFYALIMVFVAFAFLVWAHLAESFSVDGLFSNCLRLCDLIYQQVSKETEAHKFVAHQTALLYV